MAAGRAVTAPEVPAVLLLYMPDWRLVLVLKLGMPEGISDALVLRATPDTREVCGTLSTSLDLH